jgi:hypothetical protein
MPLSGLILPPASLWAPALHTTGTRQANAPARQILALLARSHLSHHAMMFPFIINPPLFWCTNEHQRASPTHTPQNQVSPRRALS